MKRDEAYNQKFYERRRELTIHSARTILQLLGSWNQIRSVVDVGCGTGTWLTVAKSLGAQRLVGYEGGWVNQGMLDDQSIELRNINFEDSMPSDSDLFDLVISLEVAEHLTSDRASAFVQSLCRLGPLVMFSAAVPMQGGRKHLNEQWQSYWARLFQANGFFAIDFVRPKIWNEESIPFYYRQNTILYANAEHAVFGAKTFPIKHIQILDLVHPILLEKVKNEELGVKESLRAAFSLPRLLYAAIHRRIATG